MAKEQAETITIRNKSRTLQVFNLPHGEFCGEECKCESVTTKLSTELEDGTKGTKDVTRRLAGSVTFLAGETKSGLPKKMQDVKAIKTAIAQGTLRLIG